jgi:hypothetical protein
MPKSKKKNGQAVSKAQTGALIQRTEAVPRNYGEVFPPRVFVKMCYSLTDPISGNATLNLLGTQVTYTINSIFAPGGGAGAHQPYGRDTMFALYNKYKVHRCDYRITSGPEPDANKSFVVIQAGPPNVVVTTGSVAVGAIRERYDAVYKPTFVMNSTSHAVESARTVHMHHACGVSKAVFDAEENYGAAMGNDPTNKVYLYAAVGCSTSTSYSTYIQSYFEFYVELYERLVVSTS